MNHSIGMQRQVGHIARPLSSPAPLQPRKGMGMVNYERQHGPLPRSVNAQPIHMAPSQRLRHPACLGVNKGAPLTVNGAPCPLRSWHPSFQCQPRQQSYVAFSSNAAAQYYTVEPPGPPLSQRILKFLLKLAAGLTLLMLSLVALLPAIISSKTGLRATLAVANRFLPGQLAVEKVGLMITQSQGLPFSAQAQSAL